ncbi:hypothetical protein J6G99_04610 [bacterium]|nr:hypothetical protein [bacterium]
MKSFIITKWIEPYRLLESIKKYYSFKDFTFDGLNKLDQKDKFFKELINTKYSIGLYMKNVNKFYLFNRNENFDIIKELIEDFNFTENDFILTDDIEKPFNMVDIGKAEAGIIIP